MNHIKAAKASAIVESHNSRVANATVNEANIRPLIKQVERAGFPLEIIEGIKANPKIKQPTIIRTSCQIIIQTTPVALFLILIFP